MRKSRTVSLEDILSNVQVEETLEEKILKELPLNKPFTSKILCNYYNTNSNTLYPTLERLTKHGVLKKYKGHFNGKNSVFIYERIK